MRFDDPEPTQLLNGYTPHLDRKCRLNCQKKPFPLPSSATAIGCMHEGNRHADKCAVGIFNFIPGILRHFSVDFIFFPVFGRKFYIFNNDNLFFLHLFDISRPLAATVLQIRKKILRKILTTNNYFSVYFEHMSSASVDGGHCVTSIYK